MFRFSRINCVSDKYLLHSAKGFHGLSSVSILVKMVIGIVDSSKMQNYYILQSDSKKKKDL